MPLLKDRTLRIIPHPVSESYKNKRGPKPGLERAENIRRIREAIRGGIISRAELARVGHVSVGSLYRYKEEGRINLPSIKKRFVRGKLAENRRLIDRLLFDEGDTFGNVGKRVGLSRERIRQYVNYIGQERHKEAKKIRREIKPKLIDVLIKAAIQKGYEDEVGEAVEYYFKKYGRRRIYGEGVSLENLIKLIQVYKEAQKDGLKLSYEELSELSGIKYAASVGKILRGMRLNSFYWNCTNRRFTFEDKKEAIKRGVGLDLSYRDLGYFLGVSEEVISRMMLRRVKRNLQIKRFGGKVEVVTYRDASQIYGFRDEFNSSNKEISEAIGKSLRVVNYALENRDEIEAKLVHALRILYLDENINKGYR